MVEIWINNLLKIDKMIEFSDRTIYKNPDHGY